MAWDATRPVPWQRMFKEWLLYAAIMLVVLLVLFRDQPVASLVIALVVSAPLYFLFGYVLAKFGYQRKSWSEIKSASKGSGGGDGRSTGSSSAGAGPRPKPAPTSRTGGAPNRPGGKRKRR